MAGPDAGQEGKEVSMKNVVIERRMRIFDDFFAIDEAWLSYEQFDGTMSPVVRRLNFERGDSVAALLFERNSQSIVLVRQFRYPTYDKGAGWLLETVAGILDEGETPEDAIRREVGEETGYRVDNLEHISTFFVSPGGSSERIILYYAEVDGSSRVDGNRGVKLEGEDIEEVKIPADRVNQMLAEGEIIDAKTLVAIFWWLARGGVRNGD
jgi:ADP-ribose pyrophosphatase